MTEPYQPSAERPYSGNSVNQGQRDELIPPSYRKNSAQPLNTSPGYFEHHHPGPQDEMTGESHNAEGSQQPNLQMDKIKRTQEAIDEVKTQLHHNIEAIHERGTKLDDLQQKSDTLSIQSRAFKNQATVVRRKMWWKNLKWTLCIAVSVIVIIVGAVGGGVKGHQVYEEHKTVTETQTVPSPPATNSTRAT